MNEDCASVPNFYHRFIMRSAGIIMSCFSTTPEESANYHRIMTNNVIFA